jgi:hypothetical protein
MEARCDGFSGFFFGHFWKKLNLIWDIYFTSNCQQTTWRHHFFLPDSHHFVTNGGAAQKFPKLSKFACSSGSLTIKADHR